MLGDSGVELGRVRRWTCLPFGEQGVEQNAKCALFCPRLLPATW